LAKVDVFNTQVLYKENIKELLKHKRKPVIIADLMEIDVFKITYLLPICRTEFLTI